TCWLIALCAFGTTLAQAQTPANPLAYSRSSAFEYDPATGLLTKEIVEPGTLSCVTTSYAYDAYGNRTSATTTDCGSGGRAAFLSRSSGSTYAASTVTLAGIGNVSIPAGAFPSTSTN
ncbi:hypothetical protein, partial [Janthinobacterium lividum]